MFENPCYPSNKQCFRGDFSNSMDRTWHRRLIGYRRMSRSACTQIFFFQLWIRGEARVSRPAAIRSREKKIRSLESLCGLWNVVHVIRYTGLVWLTRCTILTLIVYDPKNLVRYTERFNEGRFFFLKTSFNDITFEKIKSLFCNFVKITKKRRSNCILKIYKYLEKLNYFTRTNLFLVFYKICSTIPSIALLKNWIDWKKKERGKKKEERPWIDWN